MKNIFVGTFIAVAFFATPLYPSYAQIASTTEEQVASLREELISLLMQLIAQLQAQLDTKAAKDVAQDAEIEVIKRTTSTRSTSVSAAPVVEVPVDDLAVARSKAGQIEARLGLGEEEVIFSIYNYLDTDTVIWDANIMASSTEQGCSAIQGSLNKICTIDVEFPIIETDIVVSVTVNGVQKSLVLEPGKRSIVGVNWQN